MWLSIQLSFLHNQKRKFCWLASHEGKTRMMVRFLAMISTILITRLAIALLSVGCMCQEVSAVVSCIRMHVTLYQGCISRGQLCPGVSAVVSCVRVCIRCVRCVSDNGEIEQEQVQEEEVTQEEELGLVCGSQQSGEHDAIGYTHTYRGCNHLNILSLSPILSVFSPERFCK